MKAQRRMPLAKLSLASFCAVLLLSVTACRAKEAKGGNPKVLHYAFSPSTEEMQDASVRVQRMRAYLQSQLHIPVEIVRVEGYAPTIEAMHTGKVEIATFGPLGYIIASGKANAQAIVAAGTADGTLNSYRAQIVVPKSSPIHSIGDLKAHSKDLVFLFTDPASTSGNLIPRAYFQTLGIDSDNDFKKVVYAGSQVAAAFTIESGKVDAGAMSDLILARLVAVGKIAPDALRVIWTSDPIPSSPYTVRGDLPGPLKEQIRQALLDIPTKDPILWQNLKTVSRKPDMTLISVQDSAYDGLRKFATQVKDFNVVEK